MFFIFFFKLFFSG